MRKVMILAAMAALVASPAMAAFVTSANPGLMLDTPLSPQRTATGDTLDSIVGVFNAGGGTAISTGPFVFSVPEAGASMGDNTRS